MSCQHDLDDEFLYPSDTEVIEVYEDDELRLTVAVPCPDCGVALTLDAAVETVEEADFEFPLDDELYD